MFLKSSVLKYKLWSSPKPTRDISVPTISSSKGVAWQDSRGNVALHSPGSLLRQSTESLRGVAVKDLRPPWLTLFLLDLTFQRRQVNHCPKHNVHVTKMLRRGLSSSFKWMFPKQGGQGTLRWRNSKEPSGGKTRPGKRGTWAMARW